MKNKWSVNRISRLCMSVFLLISAFCPVLYNIIGSRVLVDGTLDEPFYLVVLMCISFVLFIVSGFVYLLTRKNKKNNWIYLLVSSIIILLLVGLLVYSNSVSEMPLPEVSEGMRGSLGIDKNINESNIDDYLGRTDSVYFDMRMIKDPAAYEKIGGDSYLSGFVKGFEVLPYPYLTKVVGLPSEVGESYNGKTLFREVNGKYIANYHESQEILDYFFPKDKYIFLMCGGGGYAGMTKNLLVSLGWDETKIYNVGGYWYYEGKNKVEVKNNNRYDFYKITYHDIDFNDLHEVVR